MNIAVTFTLSTSEQFVSSTSDFASIEALQSELERFVGHPGGRMTWHDRDGSKRMLAAQHIVSVTFAPAAAEIGRSVVEAIRAYEGRGDGNPPAPQPA